jgi:hypothetical protein
MTARPLANLTDDDLIARLRRAADYGFANQDRFCLDEWIWRSLQWKKQLEALSK